MRKRANYLLLMTMIVLSTFIYSIVNTEILLRIISNILIANKKMVIHLVCMLIIFMGINIFAKSISTSMQYRVRKIETIEYEQYLLKRYGMYKSWNIAKANNDVLAKVVNDVPNVINARVNLFINLLSSILSSIFGILYSMSISISCTGISIFLIVLMYAFLYRSLKDLPIYEKKLGEKHNNNYSYIWNMLQNLEIIPFLNTEKVLSKYKDNAKEIVQYAKRKSKVYANVSLGKNVIGTGVLIVVAICVAINQLVNIDSNISIPDMLALFIVIPQIASALGQILQWFSDYETYKGLKERVNSILLEKTYDSAGKSNVFQINTICFKKVSFEYVKGRKVISGVNFTLVKGKNILLLGPSGCGKSTVIKLLLGLLEGYSGDILINGNQIDNINRKSLWRKCSYIEQEGIILSATLR